MAKKTPKSKLSSFDFDSLPEVIGNGVKIVEKELQILAAKAEKQELTDSESKKLISYLTILKDVKKDYMAEVEALKKQYEKLSSEELQAIAEASKN